ncbi:hypothetical protein [Lichenihabitans psoromatis]|uniref:hypothetical protein n=1 Tax=Lichenihabitans psoromatis TaxID=2528642 RepID=UPI0010358FAD|nr:hypothetical protein [Lichenihabitans psoromatis]
MSLNDSGDESLTTAMFYLYWVRAIQRGWYQLYGEELVFERGRPYDQHKECVKLLSPKLKFEEERKRWQGYFDFKPSVTIEEIITTISVEVPVPFPVLTPVAMPIKSAEDISPGIFKLSCYEVANEIGVSGQSVDVDLTSFLRRSLKSMFAKLKLESRLNVGANRHFPRLYKWLLEIEDETNWIGGPGFRMKNASGKGAVKEDPTDPDSLKVTIKKDWL